MREKLIKLLEDFSAPVMLMDTKLMDWNIPTQQLREAIADYLIANDVVPVVRCKDCKHRGTDYCIFHIKGEPADEELLKKLDNDFCSYGERKDNEN